MFLPNAHIRAFDKFFDDAMSRGFRSPFAVMDGVLDSIQQTPDDGAEFTVYKMVPVRYRCDRQKDGSVHYNLIGGENDSTGEKPKAA
tara:strand:- start:484 stop:744 length:261 start_codon:yes stop_codon:yes gene_type:complete